ncbi:protocadherin Fat 4-like [Saccostrea echinata]|uniref:protocadherin Fat 4-like n=1 Tax=Saccostrea echinata TaxID=191078 RepID=UPI002A828143|nr:protocadherin Fat 4-like [Saccostrea echinata]
MNAVVMEGSKKGFLVYRVTATDCDYNPKYKNLTYQLSGADKEYFSIEREVYGDFQVGVIKLEKQISIDIKEMYEVNINVTDGQNSNQASLTITVEDVNDHDPEFTEPLYDFSTPETDNHTSGTPIRIKVGQVNATDKDPYKNGEISYRIVTSDVESFFNITQDGDVFLIGEVNRDQCSNHRYSFTVIAEDAGSPKRTGFTEVVVNITDVNDNSPGFKNAIYNGSIKENSVNGSSVSFNPPISAVDDDESINGTAGIRFFIMSSDPAELPFTIDNTTGRIWVNNSGILDRETNPNYTIQVVARDRLGGADCLSNTTSVTISVQDANDNPPRFTNSSYSFSILENVEYGELVGSVTAWDPDLDYSLTYYISSGGDGHFSITDKTAGNITVSKTLDREKKANYSLTVRVSDGKHDASVTVLIILEDVNDNLPLFESSLLMDSEIEERNVSYPIQIYTLKATDDDEGINAEIKYFLNYSASEIPASNMTKLFTLNENGTLLLKRKLDREERDKYSLPVFAMDGGNQTTPATIEVLVQDINDNVPVFYNHDNTTITNYSVSVLEMSPVNSIIYLPVCRDKDAGENGTVSFSLKSLLPSVNDLLAIDTNSGTVSIKSPISVNNLIHITNGTNQTVNLTYVITAKDGGTPPRSTDFTLYLVVENINDNAPVFEKAHYNFSISENATANTFVGDIKAFVVNETFYHLTYSMIEQADASSNFTITSDGKVFTKGVLDRETKSQVTFAARVVDGRVPERTAFTVVAITLLDVNDNNPMFGKPDYQYTVTENDVNPPPLIVSATDRDQGENAQLTYSLIGDTDGRFVLNETTGTLGVNGSLDREMDTYRYLQIMAVDNGYYRLSSTVNVTVRVCDVNDHAPKFESSQLTRNISENLSGVQTIAMVRAEDPDAGLNGTIVYELENDLGLFQIDSLNGTVFCTRPLDYEEQEVYNLTISATDMGSPPRSSCTNLVVQVTDIPDNVPTFSKALYEVNASISDKVGESLLKLKAGDKTSYIITEGNQERRFSLNKDTGEVKVQRSLAHGQAEYLLSVEAKNTDSNLTATTKVLINIVDFNTVSSSVPHYTASLMENNKETIVVFNLTSQDRYGAGLEYRIIRTDPPVAIGYFYITSGQVFCNQSVDRETISHITLYIESTEIQLPQGRKKRSARTGDIILEVSIGDENDNPPSFSVANVTDSLVFGVPLGAKAGDLVGVIKAFDPDSVSAGKVRYNISGGDMTKFYVYPTTGQIVVRQALYQDHRNDYTLIVTATDEDRKNDTANVTVLVVPSSSSMILTVPLANDQMMSHKHNLAQNLNELLGYKCEFEKITTHIENNRIEPCRTDITLHCIDPTKNFVVPKYLVQGIIQNKSREITAVFCKALVDPSPCGECDDVTVQRIPLKHSSKTSTTEIALIVIGALILIGGSASIALILASPKKDDEDKNDKQQQNNVDMWELESMAASSLSKATGTAAGVVNPMYTTQEGENTQTSPTAEAQVEEQSNTEKNTTRKRATSYESQEVVLNFQEDNIDDDGNHQINHSNADSGVENESDSSHSGSIQTENEMEASGGPSGEGAEGGIEIKDDSFQTKSPVNERKSIFIAMETGDTTDDEISYDGSTASGGEQRMNDIEDDLVDGGIRAEETDMAEEFISNKACDETGELNKPLSGAKSVTFKPGPPVVEEYEAQEDEVTCF